MRLEEAAAKRSVRPFFEQGKLDGKRPYPVMLCPRLPLACARRSCDSAHPASEASSWSRERRKGLLLSTATGAANTSTGKSPSIITMVRSSLACTSIASAPSISPSVRRDLPSLNPLVSEKWTDDRSGSLTRSGQRERGCGPGRTALGWRFLRARLSAACRSFPPML